MDLSFLTDVEVVTTKPSFLAEEEGFTDAEAKKLFTKLKKENRGIYVNKFNKEKPYRVSLQYNEAWHQFGTFACVEAAAAVARIAGQAAYGRRAIQNNVDFEVAAESPEFIAWMADEQNKDTIEAAKVKAA